MTTLHLVDPEVAPLIDFFAAGDLNRDTLAQVRADSEARFAMFPEPDFQPVVRSTPGRDGAPDVLLLLYDPPSENRSRPAILHIHGGGMVMGSAASSKMSYAALSGSRDIVVVSVEYRLAPEACFPGPQEDCYAGLAWLFANATTLGVDPARIAVAGESAGGGLAAALALMAHDRGEYALCGQILTYPMLDHRTGAADDPYRNATTGEFLWTRERNRFGWECLQGDYPLDDERIGWFSPSRAADLAGLAPAFIATGTLDLFFDENLDYARRLCDAGVEVELHSYPGAIHAFNVIPTARIAQRCNRDILAGTERLLGLAESPR